MRSIDLSLTIGWAQGIIKKPQVARCAGAAVAQELLSVMLSEEHVRRIQREALLRAETLSDESLRKEAANLEMEHNDAAVGDEKTELGLMAHQYTLEMIRRGLTAK